MTDCPFSRVCLHLSELSQYRHSPRIYTCGGLQAVYIRAALKRAAVEWDVI